jgi:hypothetical protein
MRLLVQHSMYSTRRLQVRCTPDGTFLTGSVAWPCLSESSEG